MRKIAIQPNYPPLAKFGQIRDYDGVWDMVPIDWLRRLPGNTLRKPVKEIMDSITKEGLREPLVILVGKNSRTAKLGEGNHRLVALREMGYTHAPARCIVGSEWGKGGPNLDYDLIPQPDEYFPADSRPSKVFNSLAVNK